MRGFIRHENADAAPEDVARAVKEGLDTKLARLGGGQREAAAFGHGVNSRSSKSSSSVFGVVSTCDDDEAGPELLN